MKKKLYSIIFLAFMFFQCAMQAGINFTLKQINVLKVGQSKKLDIIQTFGVPASEDIETVNVDGINYDILSYFYVWSDWVNDKGKIVKFEFKKDTLNAFLVLSILGEYQIHIDMNTSSFFKKGQTTKNEILSKIGLPTGVNHLPTSFKISNDIPEGTNEIIRYFRSYATNFNSLYYTNRYLIIFLDSNDKLIDYSYSENIKSF